MSGTEEETTLNEDEQRGLELIRASGGIYQSEFWKSLDLNSRKGSRIVESLLDKDMIRREEAVYEGHRTYHLSPLPKDLDFSLLMAGDRLSPFVGEEDVDPLGDAFSQWIMTLAYEE